MRHDGFLARESRTTGPLRRRHHTAAALTCCLIYATSGIERRRQILRTSLLGISVCRGIASTAPVVGFVHSE